MSSGGKALALNRRVRAGSIALGSFFIAVPIAAYLDARLGLLGAADKTAEAFGLVMAIFVVLGGVLTVSGIIGMWLMWKDVGPLNDPNAPDVGRVGEPAPAATASSQDAVPTGEGETARAKQPDGQPPFAGQQRRIDVFDADAAFVAAAKSYYDEFISAGVPFSQALQSTWRSKHGRPNYYFEVKDGQGVVRWVRVPHRGSAGAGAGSADHYE